MALTYLATRCTTLTCLRSGNHLVATVGLQLVTVLVGESGQLTSPRGGPASADPLQLGCLVADDTTLDIAEVSLMRYTILREENRTEPKYVLQSLKKRGKYGKHREKNIAKFVGIAIQGSDL